MNRRLVRLFFSLALLIMEAAGPGGCGYGQDTFHVREDLRPGARTSAPIPVPAVRLDASSLPVFASPRSASPPAGSDMDLEERNGAMRFRISFSRYSHGRLTEDGGRQFDRGEQDEFGAPFLMSILRGGLDRNAVESLGGALRPQINLQVEF